VAKDVVPKERVRLDRQDVTEQRTIADQVRKERIDVDRPDRRPRRSL
jgi:stress response protein YsnF